MLVRFSKVDCSGAVQMQWYKDEEVQRWWRVCRQQGADMKVLRVNRGDCAGAEEVQIWRCSGAVVQRCRVLRCRYGGFEV